MITVVQRVLSASVAVVEPPYKASIGSGLCVLLGITRGDELAQANWMVHKLAHLRIFKDEVGKMNNSILDCNGELLLISQFTLAGNCTKGHRPSFIHAAPPEVAEPLVNTVGELLESKHGITVKRGIFGAMMQVEIVNDGPVTLVIHRD